MFAFLLSFSLPLLLGASGAFPKPLSAQEEQQYLQLLQSGTEAEQALARQTLILHNLRLVAHIAKKYHLPQRDPEELISIGTVGLIKAILSYDAKKSIRLATYAAKCVQNEILMHLRASRKAQNDISLYEPIGIDRDGNEIVMLDVMNSDTPDFADQLDDAIRTQQMLAAVQTALSRRERIVICLRYGLGGREPLTQQEIAKMLGISRSYVSRIEKKALKKLHTAMQEA